MVLTQYQWREGTAHFSQRLGLLVHLGTTHLRESMIRKRILRNRLTSCKTYNWWHFIIGSNQLQIAATPHLDTINSQSLRNWSQANNRLKWRLKPTKTRIAVLIIKPLCNKWMVKHFIWTICTKRVPLEMLPILTNFLWKTTKVTNQHSRWLMVSSFIKMVHL